MDVIGFLVSAAIRYARKLQLHVNIYNIKDTKLNARKIFLVKGHVHSSLGCYTILNIFISKRSVWTSCHR